MKEPLLATGRGRGAAGVIGRGRGRSGMPVDGGADGRAEGGGWTGGVRGSSGARGDGDSVLGSASSGAAGGAGGTNRSMAGAVASYDAPRSVPRSAGDSVSCSMVNVESAAISLGSSGSGAIVVSPTSTA